MPGTEPRAWVDGRLFTGDGWAEAALSENGRFIAVGSTEEIRRAAPTGTIVDRLNGHLAIPGLVDPHLHWLDSVVADLGVDLRGCRNLRDLAHRLETAPTGTPDGVLLGHGWDQERFEGHRTPTRRDLDAIEPDRPVVLTRICEHAAVLNSAALGRLGIDRHTATPSGGRIGHDAYGEPDGFLADRALERLRPIYEALFLAQPASAHRFLSRLAARGLTMIGAMNARDAEIACARALAPAGLPVAVRAYLAGALAPDAARWKRMLRGPEAEVVGIKLVLDGSLGARTAWLEAPYADRPTELGHRLLSREEAETMVEHGRGAGLQVAFHAIGDGALREAIDLAQRCPGEVRIEHASVVPPSWMEPLVQLRAPIVIQPGFLESDTWLLERLGPDRARWAYPFRDLVERGAALSASSAAPVEPIDPRIGHPVQVERVGLAPERALRLYTTAAAGALRVPLGGRITVGAPADLALLDAEDLASAIAARGPVSRVIRGGRVVAGEGAI